MTLFWISFLISIIVISSATGENSSKGTVHSYDLSETQQTVNVSKGDTLKLFCLSPSEFEDTVRVAWLKDGKAMTEGMFPRVIFGKPGITVNKIRPKESGVYACNVTHEHNTDFSVLKSIQVVVFKPPKVQKKVTEEDYWWDEEDEEVPPISCSHPEFQNISNTTKFLCFDFNDSKKKMNSYLVKAAGTSVNLYCNPKGYPKPEITWYKDEKEFNTAGFHHRLANSKNSLQLMELVQGDEARYTCEAKNSYGKIRYDIRLIVTPRFGSLPIVPEIKNVTVLIGEDIELDCDAHSDEHLFHFEFVRGKGDQISPIESRTNNETILDDPHILFLENATSNDTGWYSCLAANSIGRSEVSVYVDVVKEVFLDAISEETKQTNVIVFAVLVLMLGLIILVSCTLGIVARKYPYAVLKFSMNKKERLNVWTKEITIDRVPVDDNDEGAILIPEVNIKNVISKSKDAQEYQFPVDEKWEFPRDKLILGKHLGEGAFGEVRQGTATGIIERGIASTVAVKSLKKTHTDAEMIDLISEMETMKELGKHQNIINLLGCCTTGGELLVIMEFAEHGNLRDFLRNNRHQFIYERPRTNAQNTVIPIDASSPSALSDENLTFRDLMSFAYQVARGMDYLVQRKYVHRDLAARNILVASNKVVKIADFGMTRNIFVNDYYRKKSDGRVPVKWMAPETLFHRIYTTHSDVWSYGILLWEIVTLGATPYPAWPDFNKLFEFLKSGKRMLKPANCPTELYLIMRDCWIETPAARPSFSDLVEDIGRIVYIASGTEYFELEGMEPLEEGEVITPPSSPENSADGTIMFDPEFLKSFSEP